MNTLDFIKQHKLVSICRQVYGHDLLKAAQCIHAEGIRLMEITFDQADPEGIIKTADSIALIKDKFGDDMRVGAGTVMTADQVKAAKQAGADFALAPNTDIEIIHVMKEHGLIAIPGAMTPSEIVTAYQAGADIVKVFPASILGAAYIKAVRGPINHIPLMAVGGIEPENVVSMLKAGCCGAGIGSNLISKARVKAGDFAAISNTAQAFIQAIQSIK